MDIKLPYKWIKEYLNTDLSASEFAQAISLGGPSIEKWHENKKLDDFILDIEITSNRVDMASVVGIAREGSAILGIPLLYKEVDAPPTPKNKKAIEVIVENEELCPRYQALVVDGIEVKESPQWMQDRLEELGMNSINNLVDISNYVLLEYGQPTHIFDYDKVEDSKIIVRSAKDGEKFTTLDKQEKELNENDLVIADPKKILGLAGVKGGISSGISNDTKTIVIESANFDAYSIRKSARGHDLYTDAASLFEKGLNIENTTPALRRVLELVLELAGGQVVSEVQDVNAEPFSNRIITFNQSQVERILGIEVEESEIIDILDRLGFKVEKWRRGRLLVTVPFYRHEDVYNDYDLVEEIARIYGYHRIPAELPSGAIPAVQKDQMLVFEDQIKLVLQGIGFTEAFTRSLISKKALDASGYSEDEVLSVANTLSEDFTYMRRELFTSMLTVMSQNEEQKESLELFELNNVYVPQGKAELPNEVSMLTIAVNDKDAKKAYLKLKGFFELLLERLHINEDDVKFDADYERPFAKGASAEIEVGEQEIGKIGVVSEEIRKHFGIKKQVALLEINVEYLFEQAKHATPTFTDIPKYPPVARDFAFVVDLKISWDEIQTEVRKVLSNVESVTLFDVYEGDKLPDDKKSVAFRVVLRSPERTLSEKDIEKEVANVDAVMDEKFGAEKR